MFLTREERQPLGGVFSYWLPSMITGGAWLCCLWMWLTSVWLIAGADRSLAETGWFGAASGLGVLFFCGRAGKWLPSLLTGMVVGAIGFAAWGLRPDTSPLWPWIVAWLAAASLAGGIVDAAGRERAVPPPWRYVLAEALRIPITVIFIVLFAGLLSIQVASLGDIGYRDWARPLVALGTMPWVKGIFLGLVWILPMGIVAALVRRQRVLIGSLRYALVWVARPLLPVLAVICAAFAVNLALRPDLVSVQGYLPALKALPVALGLCAVLVYQTGDIRRPPLWLRLTMSVTPVVLLAMVWPMLSVLPVLVQGGLSAQVVLAFSDTILVAVLAVLLLAGVFSQMIPGRQRWMPVLAPVLTGFLALIALWPLLIGGLMRLGL